MIHRSRALLLLVCASVLVAGCRQVRVESGGNAAVAAPARGETVVVLVRHAEQGGQPASDPPLTAAGAARATALRQHLAGVDVQAIYVSDRARTQLTAAPIAQLHGITPVVVPVPASGAAAQAAETVRQIRATQQGRTVLVVGHSNTVPMLVEALSGVKVPEIGDKEFDNVYVVRIPPTGAATLTRAKYGAPTPPS